jgi:hypothetical protein
MINDMEVEFSARSSSQEFVIARSKCASEGPINVLAAEYRVLYVLLYLQYPQAWILFRTYEFLNAPSNAWVAGKGRQQGTSNARIASRSYR